MDAEQIDQVRALHAGGMGCNEIAREVGVAPATVSVFCANAGLTFDREQTRAATRARQADLALRRAELQAGLLEDAEKLRAQLFAPTVVFAFGGKDNTYESRPVDQPPVRDQRDLVHAVSTAVNASLRLADHDQDADVGDARSMLGDLARGLTAAYQAMGGTDGSEDGAGDADSDDQPAARG